MGKSRGGKVAVTCEVTLQPRAASGSLKSRVMKEGKTRSRTMRYSALQLASSKMVLMDDPAASGATTHAFAAASYRHGGDCETA